MNEVVKRLQGEMSGVLRGLDRDLTQKRPTARPAGWTIQQIVEHLRLTYAATNRVMAERIAKGTKTKARPSPAQWAGQFAVTRLGHFPKDRVAPPGVVPKDVSEPLTGEELNQLLVEDLERMDAMLAEAERVLGHGRSVSHIILGPMSITGWRRFHLAHGRHHAKQIAAISRERAVQGR